LRDFCFWDNYRQFFKLLDLAFLAITHLSKTLFLLK